MNTIRYQQQTLTPSKVVCIGRNYVEHIAELNNEVPTEPVVFIKPNSAIATRLLTDAKAPIHYEAEICLLILQGQIAAVGFGLDLTKRTLQSQLKSKGLPWERAKAFDNSALFSEFVPVTGNLAALSLQLFINQSLVQSANYDLMIYKPEQLLAEVKSFLTLEDGDILMTGTPKGVGQIQPGDMFNAKILLEDKLLIEAEWQAQVK